MIKQRNNNFKQLGHRWKMFEGAVDADHTLLPETLIPMPGR